MAPLRRDERRLIESDGEDNSEQAPRTRVDTISTRTSNHQQPHSTTNNDTQSQALCEEEPVKYTSQLAALLIIVNVTIGAGLLAMPYSVQTAGIVTSMILQAILLVAIITTCIMCTELIVKTGGNSFHGVINVHCNRFVYQFTQACILLLVFGTTVAYIVVVGDQFDRVFASLYGPSFCYSWYLNRRFIMSAVTVFVMKPLCCAKTVDFLKYGSFAGIVSIGFIVYVVVSEFIKQDHIAGDVNYVPKDVASIGSILPVLCLAYQCHLSWVPTAATIRKEDKYTTYVTISVAMIIASIIYTTVSILAVLTFGSSIVSDLTESYPGHSWPILTTIAIVAFKCMVTLPPAFLPARLSLVDILSSTSRRFSELGEATKRISVTSITLSIALILALYVPDIIIAVDFLGCLSVMFIFTLPALAYLNLVKENRLMKQQLAGLDSEVPIYSLKDKFKRATSFVLIVFGLVMTFVVLYKSIEGVLSKGSSQPLCHK